MTEIDIIRLTSEGVLSIGFGLVLRVWFSDRESIRREMRDRDVVLGIIKKEISYIKKTLDSISEIKSK